MGPIEIIYNGYIEERGGIDTAETNEAADNLMGMIESLLPNSDKIPFYFRTAEFVAENPTAESAGTFRFQWKGGVIGAAGNAVLIYRIIFAFQACPGIERNVSFQEMLSVSICIGAKGAARQEFLIKPGGVKGSIS